MDFLAGNRIRGTTTEKATLVPAVTGTGGWKEVGRTTLGSTTEPITVSSLPDKKYYMILTNVFPNSGRAATTRRLGYNSVDTGSNYSSRRSDNGSSPGNTNINRQHSDNVNLSSDATPQFCVDYCSNISSKEKLGQTLMVLQNTAGASNAPERAESVWKWTNTSNPLNIYEIKREPSESVDWLSGSECVVLGWDPTDTHTTNFWEELTTKQGTGAGSPLTTDTFTAKKYLWIQMYIDASSSCEFRVGTGGTIDTGSNYALRTSSNGGTDETKINQVHLNAPTSKGFINMFIVNNSANEKLCIYHLIDQGTAGAGNPPSRREYVGKWINTSGQIDVVQLYGSGVTFNADSVIKVWGSD